MYVHVHKLFDKGKVHGEDPYPWLYTSTKKNIIYKTNAAFQIHVYGVIMHESFHYNNNWIKNVLIKG